MTVHIGRGSIIVDGPSDKVKSGLRRFRRKGGVGEYEDLFVTSGDEKSIVTMPGFADRIRRLCKGSDADIRDERNPMPSPDFDAAARGVSCVWKDVVVDALGAGGGIVSIPDMFGTVDMVAAILRAFPREGLLERGTPLSFVATNGNAGKLARKLREALPGRDVEALLPSGTDGEDVIVVPYSASIDFQYIYGGLFIGTDLQDIDFLSVAKNVSALRNAARWGIWSTSHGCVPEIGMDAEGLFGPLCASASYSDAVRARIGVPITVVWVPSPKPEGSIGSAPFSILEGVAMTRNVAFARLVAGIVRHVPNDVGCIVCAEREDVARRISALLPGVVEVGLDLSAYRRKELVRDIENGTIRKAIVSKGAFPSEYDHGVIVLANCSGDWLPGWNIPWRRAKGKTEKTYVVDFSHEWDRHNGRPGRLARNDEARMRSYSDMLFCQMSVEGEEQLPF